MIWDSLLNGTEVDDDLLEVLVGQRRIAPLGWHIHPPSVVRVGRGAAFDEELDEDFVGRPWQTAQVRRNWTRPCAASSEVDDPPPPPQAVPKSATPARKTSHRPAATRLFSMDLGPLVPNMSLIHDLLVVSFSPELAPGSIDRARSLQIIR
jgi:hypothetical protein